jgi:alpha-amylase/alpha-mannosidase (GH57 family)
MDGENAWEYFPENGYYFLSALYNRLAAHPGIELTTFSECLKNKVENKTLNRLVAGSWVYGTFSTWIGDTDKNRGWDMLGDAKMAFKKLKQLNCNWAFAKAPIGFGGLATTIRVKPSVISKNNFA